MNLIIKENVSIIISWLIFVIILISIICLLPISIKSKTIVLISILITVKHLRFIFIFIITYILLVCGYKRILPIFSTFLFKYHFNTIHNLDSIFNKPPCIFVTNYPCPFYNYFISGLLPKNTIFIGKKTHFFGIHLISDKYYALKTKNNYNNLLKFIQRSNQDNYNVILFAEEIHTKDKRGLYQVGRIKTGIFSIAKELQIPVVPIVIGVIDNHYGIPSKYSHYVYADKPFLVDNVEDSKNKVKKLFIKHIRKSLYK